MSSLRLNLATWSSMAATDVNFKFEEFLLNTMGLMNVARNH